MKGRNEWNEGNEGNEGKEFFRGDHKQRERECTFKGSKDQAGGQRGRDQISKKKERKSSSSFLPLGQRQQWQLFCESCNKETTFHTSNA